MSSLDLRENKLWIIKVKGLKLAMHSVDHV